MTTQQIDHDFDTEDDTEDETPVEPESTRGKPSYELEYVGEELPAKPERVEVKSKLTENLEAIQAHPGDWFKVATYSTTAGARSVIKDVQKGERRIPAGRYELEARIVRNDDGTKGSALFARYLGEPV